MAVEMTGTTDIVAWELANIVGHCCALIIHSGKIFFKFHFVAIEAYKNILTAKGCIFTVHYATI